MPPISLETLPSSSYVSALSSRSGNPQLAVERLPSMAEFLTPPALLPARLARVVYFVSSHVNPEQVTRLVRACRSGNPESRVLIHHDYSVSNLDAASATRFGNVDFAPKQLPLGWGKFAACEMVIDAMRWLIKHRDFDWVIFLSGQDYPIKPLATIEAELAATEHDGFIEAKPFDDVAWHIGHGRYDYHFYNALRFPGWAGVRRHLRQRMQTTLAVGKHSPRVAIPSERHGERRIGLKPMRSPFNNNYRGYFGSQWWTLSRKALSAMLRTSDARPDLAWHYRRTLWAPTESFFHTLLLNDRSLKLATTDAKRFISWSHPETGHPDILTRDDLDRAVASGAHFARKIDARLDPALLDTLDRGIS